jgi:hypothetical protein
VHCCTIKQFLDDGGQAKLPRICRNLEIYWNVALLKIHWQEPHLVAQFAPVDLFFSKNNENSNSGIVVNMANMGVKESN